MKKSVKILLSVATFAYDPYTCSLQNLINPGSCNPNLVLMMSMLARLYLMLE
ncbi:TPA: hypothetical protein ACYKMU_000750 [Campylobacter coli]